jgi:hypothetical protein
MRIVLYLLTVILLLGACKKKDNAPEPNPPLSKIPSISIVNLSATSVKALSDTLTINIKYTDGDGDIGFENADSAVVYVTDNRFPITMSYHVPPLNPTGTTVSITGTLPIVVKNIILQNGSVAENATFSVKLRDRAGNWSNTAITSTVVVVP